MKTYMVYDYSEDKVLMRYSTGELAGTLVPYCFSTSEKAEEFLFSYNSDGWLASRDDAIKEYGFCFDWDPWRRVYMYKIIEVEVDRLYY